MPQEKSKKKEKAQSKESDGLPPQTLAEKCFLALLCVSSIVFTLLVTFYKPFRVTGIGKFPFSFHSCDFCCSHLLPESAILLLGIALVSVKWQPHAVFWEGPRRPARIGFFVVFFCEHCRSIDFQLHRQLLSLLSFINNSIAEFSCRMSGCLCALYPALLSPPSTPPPPPLSIITLNVFPHEPLSFLLYLSLLMLHQLFLIALPLSISIWLLSQI
jgi:hypothetical protein